MEGISIIIILSFAQINLACESCYLEILRAAHVLEEGIVNLDIQISIHQLHSSSVCLTVYLSLIH